jgi:hypothetical protein
VREHPKKGKFTYKGLFCSFELGEQKNQFRISIESKVENPLMTIESFNHHSSRHNF